MKTKLIGMISSVETILVTLWLVLLILGVASEGTITTFEQRLAQVAKLDLVFYLLYINATLLTISATMLFAGLYVLSKSTCPEWSAIGIVFVPVYCVLNLFVYLSQITIVPQLLELHQQSQLQAMNSLLLRQMLQQWPDSAILTVNLSAYAVLGIPSITFGGLMLGYGKTMRVAGVLLALNGIIAILGFVGIVLHNAGLAFIGAAGSGVLFWLALFPLTWALLQEQSGLHLRGRNRRIQNATF